MLEDFPPHVQAEVKRILNEAARRLLEEELARAAGEREPPREDRPEYPPTRT